MKTVIQVVQHLRPGGIEIIALDLLSFEQPDEKTFIVSLEGNIKTSLTNWPKLARYRDRLIFLDKQPGLTPSLIFTLRSLFNQLSANAVHTHHIGPLLYAGLAARLSGVKTITHTEHDAWHLDNKKRCLIQRTAIKVLQPILVADAQAVADNMQVRLRCKNKITVIHNGVDTEYFSPAKQRIAREKLNLPEGVKIIGCSGRMEEVKGQSVLINALKALPKDIHVAFAGTGSTEQSLRAQAKKLNLSQRIHFLGHIDQMPTFYQSLDIFCLPSLNEGFPLSPLEAQACNIKTLVTNVGASKETLCPESGQLVEPNDDKAMAKILLNMSQKSAECSPRIFVKQQGDVKKMVNAYAQLRNSQQQ